MYALQASPFDAIRCTSLTRHAFVILSSYTMLMAMLVLTPCRRVTPLCSFVLGVEFGPGNKTQIDQPAFPPTA
ncbi:hypothetical protein N656DRAFT_210169 [Canariomyces notabilis]|uniref:Uncharacterized protein n=1 Tax=Canariomyces notabilis TaxID=2074819 RepID=A0AAN6TAX0_9PEZI|nr:hypothetical protein N656DRAFT_210169 [Canariomyces arenarius]